MSITPRCKAGKRLRGTKTGQVYLSIAAAELLDKNFGVSSDIWSCPGFNELARDAIDAERFNRLHPEAKSPRKPYVTGLL